MQCEQYGEKGYGKGQTHLQNTKKSRKTHFFLKKNVIFFASLKKCRNFALAIRKRIHTMTP